MESNFLESGLLDTAARFVAWPCFLFFHLRGWGMSGDTSIRPCTVFRTPARWRRATGHANPREYFMHHFIFHTGHTGFYFAGHAVLFPPSYMRGGRGGVICDSRCSHGSISPEVVGGNHTQGARTTPFARWGFGRGPWDPSSSPLRTPFDEEVAGRPRSGLEGCTARPRQVP